MLLRRGITAGREKCALGNSVKGPGVNYPAAERPGVSTSLFRERRIR